MTDGRTRRPRADARQYWRVYTAVRRAT